MKDSGSGKKYKEKNHQNYSKDELIKKAFEFHANGNILEASKYYQEFINQGFKDHRVFSNYGVILKNIGKLKEAEISLRKAIEIKPDYPVAHFNLGNILRDLGNLQELILLLKSTLRSTSINQGYKLLATLEITIANLIRGDFSETFLHINKTNKLINQGGINTIKDKENKNYSLNFSRFITSLYPLLNKDNNNSDSEKIPHIGDSHCLSFTHQTLSISSQLKRIQPVYIAGGKAWHFANKNHNKWKDSLNQQIKNHKYCDKILISFGEIDCRKDEGILNYSIKNDKNISTICITTIKSYMDYIEKTLSPHYSKRFYFGIPAPTRTKKLLDELDVKRIEMIKIYNSLLKQEVLSVGSSFLDVYALTSTKDGENNNLHMCDQFHLSPKCLSILFENFLYKN